MRKVKTSELVPGMITAEDVYSFNYQLIVPKGTILTDKSITRLEVYSVTSVYITNPEGFDLSDEEPEILVPEKKSYYEKIKETKEFKEFETSFMSNSEALKGNLHDIIENNSIDTDQLLSSVSSLISKGSTSIGMFDMLHNMRTYDDLTYVHSMSVSIICNMIGKWLDFNEDDLQVLTIAGLLHDIGKLSVPEEIIKKPGKLTDREYSIVKTHTLQGYQILKNLDIDIRIKASALMHHERCDGTGYPLGYKEKRIDDFAKIVAIADVYDAMTAARCYRGPMCPFKVIAIFEQEGLQKYKTQYILTFLQRVGETYLNNRVILNNGTEGDIVMINKNAISKPLIRCLDGSYVNLETEKDLFIEQLI